MAKGKKDKNAKAMIKFQRKIEDFENRMLAISSDDDDNIYELLVNSLMHFQAKELNQLTVGQIINRSIPIKK